MGGVFPLDSSRTPRQDEIAHKAIGVCRGNSPEQVAGMLANFGEVPLLAGHHGEQVGALQAIFPDGSDVWFVATVHNAAVAERLRHGPVEVSLESAGRGIVPRTNEPGTVYGPLSEMPPISPFYRGSIGVGWTMTAVALLLDGIPALKSGSALWFVE